MIPKKIHYCWFGKSELPKFAKKCIESWKKYCPEFEIIEWNENNYDVYKNSYMKEAYENKKWAFVSDFARLDIIYREGGFYLDIDVELIRSLDSLCNKHCVLGIESTGYINTGLGFGAEKENKVIELMLKEYKNIHFLISQGIFNDLPCPVRNTFPLVKYGFDKTSNNIQVILNAYIYPKEYFCPVDYETEELNITSNTFSIHHFNGTWIPRYLIEYEDFLTTNKDKKNKLYCFVYKLYLEYKSIFKSFNIINMLSFIYGKITKKILKIRYRKYYNI